MAAASDRYAATRRLFALKMVASLLGVGDAEKLVPIAQGVERYLADGSVAPDDIKTRLQPAPQHGGMDEVKT